MNSALKHNLAAECMFLKTAYFLDGSAKNCDILIADEGLRASWITLGD